MRNIVFIITLLILTSCGNNVRMEQSSSDGSKAVPCEVLNIPYTILSGLMIDEIKKTNLDKRMELSQNQEIILSDIVGIESNGNIYLYGIKSIYEDVVVLFVLVEGVSGDTFYMITTDCSSKKIDYISLTECDYFDVTEQREDNETGVFITKYFKMLNDTIVSVRNITKQEVKRLNDGKILESQIDSVTLNYHLNRKGKIKLVQRDSVRIISDK